MVVVTAAREATRPLVGIDDELELDVASILESRSSDEDDDGLLDEKLSRVGLE